MIKILLQIYSKPISLATNKVIILYTEKYKQWIEYRITNYNNYSW
jgi:hypothetical protein